MGLENVQLCCFLHPSDWGRSQLVFQLPVTLKTASIKNPRSQNMLFIQELCQIFQFLKSYCWPFFKILKI
jgi:hypothetical protein